jgi:hypothetical protein
MQAKRQAGVVTRTEMDGVLSMRAFLSILALGLA